MASQDDLNQMIENIAGDVNGFIGASVVDLESGMPLANISRVPNFDLEVASAYNSEMVKAKNKTIRALGLDSDLEDMLLTLNDQLHLIKLLSPSVFIYLAADRKNTNLALLRSSVNRHTAAYRD